MKALRNSVDSWLPPSVNLSADRVIGADKMAKTISQDIAAAVKYEANIHIEDGGTRFGSSGINIRGIGGNREALEEDGEPNDKTFNLGSYYFATADFPEIDLIQNIEILKGPFIHMRGQRCIGWYGGEKHMGS